MLLWSLRGTTKLYGVIIKIVHFLSNISGVFYLQFCFAEFWSENRQQQASKEWQPKNI